MNVRHELNAYGFHVRYSAAMASAWQRGIEPTESELARDLGLSRSSLFRYRRDLGVTRGSTGLSAEALEQLRTGATKHP